MKVIRRSGNWLGGETPIAPFLQFDGKLTRDIGHGEAGVLKEMADFGEIIGVGLMIDFRPSPAEFLEFIHAWLLS
jgi:hypothetical protein